MPTLSEERSGMRRLASSSVEPHEAGELPDDVHTHLEGGVDQTQPHQDLVLAVLLLVRIDERGE